MTFKEQFCEEIEEAQELGRKKGEKRGRAEGEAIGEKRGRAEGERNKALQAARILVESGVSLEIISKSTGLSEEKIRAL